jgi:hypothetical protein
MHLAVCKGIGRSLQRTLPEGPKDVEGMGGCGLSPLPGALALSQSASIESECDEGYVILDGTHRKLEDRVIDSGGHLVGGLVL